MELHNDAVKALEFPPKEDKRDFGPMDEERSTKEEDLLASLLEDMGLDGDDIWEVICLMIMRSIFIYRVLGHSPFTS